MNDILKKTGLSILLVAVLISSNAATYIAMRRDADTKINALRSELQTSVRAVQTQLADLQGAIAKNQTDSEKAVASVSEEVKRQQEIQASVLPAVSQDDLLTRAVAKVTPSVVSVAISKDVPQLEVVYENPYANDPLLKDLGITVPVYRQKGTEKQKVGGGTGFIVTSDGYIVTNRHVVADDSASYTVLLSTGKVQTARVIYKDEKQDIAIIKIDARGLPAVTLGSSGSLKLGQSVIAIGNVLAEYDNSVSVGIISGLNRTIQASDSNGAVEQLTGVIQTDAAINPGNSGGPLLDLSGRVVGVNVATVEGASSIGFSVPVDMVKSIVKTWTK